jgi:hypothetical protein
MMQTQKECVYGIVCEVCGVDGARSKEQLQQIYEMVTTEIVAGNVNYDFENAKNKTPEDIRAKYVPGMVSNWLRKDLRLNGGEKYATKNPGSRMGSGDEQLKNLKALKSLHPEHSAAIDEQIAVRLAEIAPKKTVTVDLDKIPEALRAQLGL